MLHILVQYAPKLGQTFFKLAVYIVYDIFLKNEAEQRPLCWLLLAMLELEYKRGSSSSSSSISSSSSSSSSSSRSNIISDIYSFIYLLFFIYLLIYSFIHSFIDLFIHFKYIYTG